MDGETNPFVRYRQRLASYQQWIAGGRSDQGFVDMVTNLDAAIATVDGHGFVVTPTTVQPDLAAALGLASGCELIVKDETNNVGGSHKARHLFGLLLHLTRAEPPSTEPPSTEPPSTEPSSADLAIASCGNAAIGAAVVAKAAGRRLRVFIPDWADGVVEASLVGLGAHIVRCERRPGEVGDPAYLRFLEALDSGCIPFSVQGTVAPHVLDGGRTIGWELAEQLHDVEGGPARLDVVVIQVGGGALGSALVLGLADGVAAGWLESMPRIMAVQTEAAAPLYAAWQRLVATADPLGTLLSGDADALMEPWPAVGNSLASGILDDVTYDWNVLSEFMLSTGGSPVVVSESDIVAAHNMATQHTSIEVCGTGAAGSAGLIGAVDLVPGDRVAVVFSGHER